MTNAEIKKLQEEVYWLPRAERIAALQQIATALTEAEKKKFSEANQDYYAAHSAQIKKEMEAAKKDKLMSDILTGATFVLVGAEIPSIFGAVSNIFAPAATGYVAGPGGDIAAAAMEQSSFGTTALTIQDAWLAPEALPAIGETMGITPVATTSFWDKLYNAGKSAVGSVGTAANVYSALKEQVSEVAATLSPIFETVYPTAADRTNSGEYTKIEGQDQVTGGSGLDGSAVPVLQDSQAGVIGSSALLVVGGVVLLYLLSRK